MGDLAVIEKLGGLEDMAKWQIRLFTSMAIPVEGQPRDASKDPEPLPDPLS